ncbi:MAG: hypothetical protein NTV86_23400 [Planctomycetota bacterium]|nr:hypothetical protein [Planctomycetota bacterium]
MKRRLPRIPPALSRAMTIAIGAAFLGSGVTSITGKPPLAMAGMTLMAAVAGATSSALRRGLVRGLFIGLIGGAAIVFSLNHMRVQNAYLQGPPAPAEAPASQPATSSRPASGPVWQFRPQWVVADREIAGIAGATLVMSLAAAGVFAWAAQRRRDLMG